jgi:hypothetical protein
MVQTLFTWEHNAICAAWYDDRLFALACLLLAALLARIHTVEWTPALISHPRRRRADWWGLETERLQRLFGYLGKSEIISGIPGSDPHHHFEVPYALTEEFTIAYHMHPLIPDRFRLRSTGDDRLIREHFFLDLSGPRADEVVRQVAMTDHLYSFGTAHPGAIVLHNYPRSLAAISATRRSSHRSGDHGHSPFARTGRPAL